PTGLDPRHRRHARARTHLPRRAVLRGDVTGHRRLMTAGGSEPNTTTEVAMSIRQRRSPRDDERGEGVSSTAIAVLIVAFLGIALWTGFNGMMDDATDRTRAQVEQIGG